MGAPVPRGERRTLSGEAAAVSVDAASPVLPCVRWERARPSLLFIKMIRFLTFSAIIPQIEIRNQVPDLVGKTMGGEGICHIGGKAKGGDSHGKI